MNLKVPQEWEVAQSKTGDGPEINVSDPQQRMNITALRINMGQKISIPDIVEIMENEINAEIPFVASGKGTTLSSLKPLNQNFEINFKEYTGTLQEEELTVIIGYGCLKNKAYVIIGIYGSEDRAMRNNIIKVLESFSP
ncbi:hypothetical protein D0S45_18485 [Marinifilum sp. JC120]|nr:hypothetical protein D0S45_18485 [Marinifilum sp. JC120]